MQACRTDTKEPDHANTCRPIIRACTGFFDKWEASVNVHVGQSRLDQTFAFSKPESRRMQDRLKPVHQFVTNSNEHAGCYNNQACSIQMHGPASYVRGLRMGCKRSSIYCAINFIGPFSTHPLLGHQTSSGSRPPPLSYGIISKADFHIAEHFKDNNFKFKLLPYRITVHYASS